ncbi:3710_t:CDS:2, partial [Gigaspora rosea]
HIEPDPNEEWREIELDSRKFRVSSLGRTQLADGVITQAFYPKEEGKKYVNHIDGNTINNKSSNLEWCTPKENAQYTVRLGLGYQRAIKQILDNSSFQEFPSLAEA